MYNRVKKDPLKMLQQVLIANQNTVIPLMLVRLSFSTLVFLVIFSFGYFNHLLKGILKHLKALI